MVKLVVLLGLRQNLICTKNALPKAKRLEKRFDFCFLLLNCLACFGVLDFQVRTGLLRHALVVLLNFSAPAISDGFLFAFLLQIISRFYCRDIACNAHYRLPLVDCAR